MFSWLRQSTGVISDGDDVDDPASENPGVGDSVFRPIRPHCHIVEHEDNDDTILSGEAMAISTEKEEGIVARSGGG